MASWDDIDKPCPSCGLIGVFMCSSRDCPMKDAQKSARDKWQERQNDPNGTNEAQQ